MRYYYLVNVTNTESNHPKFCKYLKLLMRMSPKHLLMAPHKPYLLVQAFT